MILAVLASLTLASPPEDLSAAAEALASGDAHYARRAEGARGGIADAVHVDRAIAKAGAYLILGRLHVEAPRIPMLTGWVSRQKGLAHLRTGLAIAPDNTALMYFLADALLTVEPSSKEEARALLQRCANTPPRAEYAVEDAHYAGQARERLASLP